MASDSTVEMAHEFQWNRETGVLLVTFSGVLTLTGLRASLEEGRRLCLTHGLAAAIVDFSGVSRFEMSLEAVRSIAQDNPVTGVPRVAVAPQAVIFGSVRMVQLTRGERDRQLKVVPTMDEALTLLGLPPLPFEPVLPPE